MAALLATTSFGTARLLHMFAAPVIFAGVALSYFRGRHAWAPLRAALVFAVLVGLLDLVVAASFLQHDLTMFRSVDGFWGPIVLIAVATWIVGAARGRRVHGSASGTVDHARA